MLAILPSPLCHTHLDKGPRDSKIANLEKCIFMDFGWSIFSPLKSSLYHMAPDCSAVSSQSICRTPRIVIDRPDRRSDVG